MASIFQLTRKDFMAALPELAQQGVNTDDLLRSYNAQNDATAGLRGSLGAPSQSIADSGRAQTLGGILSYDPSANAGMDRIRSVDFEPRAAAQDAIGGLFGAGQNVYNAMSGRLPTEDLQGAAFDAAGLVAGLGAASAGRGLLDYDPNTMRAGIPWRERVESSIPKSWLEPKFDKPQWNQISKVSSVIPESDMKPIHTPTGTLAPEVALRLEDFKGYSAIPALGDRSVAGVEIGGVGNKVYGSPTRSLGGADFMRERGTGLWANDFKPARDLAKTAENVLNDGGDPLMIYTAMGPQSGDFSTMMMESVLNDFDPSRIDPRVAQIFDDRIRGAKGGIPSWEGLLAPNLQERLANDMTGSQRWQLWQEMDKALYRDNGLPDINMARRSITDPRLLNATPFDSGLTVGRMSGGLLDDPDIRHPTYNTQIDGEYLGGLPTIPGPILFRDFFEKRRNSGEATGSDQRSFLMNSPRIAQKIDQQTIDEYYQMKEAIRGVNDPDSFLKLWKQNQ